MNFSITGDLASSLMSRRTSASLKSELQRLTQEAGTGRVTDVARSTKGELAPIASVKRSLALLDAHATSASKTALKLTSQDLALQAISQQISELGPAILTAANSGPVAFDAAISSHADRFSGAVSALSTKISGSYVFSGVSVDTAPLAAADDMLAELEVVTAGSASAADFYQRIDDWFNLPGGFDQTGYLGSDANSDPLEVSSTETIHVSLTADALEVKNVLKDLAVLSLVADGAFLGNAAERKELASQAAGSLISGTKDLIEVRANVGAQLERLSLAEAQNASERYALSESYNQITGVDLFETATRLEEVQLQLESLYLITARTSRLNLTEFLR
ncbi:flagellin [uncultured Litoreibacter sp.]|uniref:flagellin n=1 Tax=uncultured Litoreibacter sp. TaxID=1392394 RepID=UPI00262FD102|nr:flagellin [uncultured Litoreibacter sp.]